ncbi:MAG: PKD domain-containing protein [bacterium]
MKRLTSLAGIAVLLAACSDASTSTVKSGIAVQSATKSSALNSSLIPGQYIVVFKNTVLNPVAMASSIALQHRTTATYTYTGALKGVALALSDAEANAMRTDPNVAYVEQDQEGTLATTQSNPIWGLDRIDQRARPLDNAYVYNGDGTGVTVYIMDTGINYAHVDFGGRAVPGADFVTPSLNGDDCDGHGTGIASLVGGKTYGVAKNVRLVSLRVRDCALGLTSSRIIAAIDWIAAHPSLPSVVNMSISFNNSPAVVQAVQNSIKSGVVYAVAAGNSTQDACNWSPANAPDALTVASSDDTDSFANFSNYGPCVDVAAPGIRLFMAWAGSDTAIHYGGGTSFSTPQVAGLAALYLQRNPSATPAQVNAVIVANATPNALTNVPANTPNLLLYTGFIGAGPVSPVANFTSSCSTLSCAFDASNTSAQPTATYTWTFGDATSGSGKTPTHTYAASGTYSVTLTVSDANGTSTKVNSVTVAASTNQAPVARFTVTCPTLKCAFNGSTSSDDVGIVSYQWTWGNGRSETHAASSATNTFASAGTYMVTLTVTDGGGQTNSVSKAVQVPTSTNQAPTASITSPSNGASAVQGTAIAFAGSGADPEDGALSGSSLTWSSSRDGQIGTGTSFATSSLSVGSHVITLTARDAQGLTGSATRSITITASAPPPPPTNQAPVARFTATCGAPASHRCTMNGSTSTDDVSIVSYTWDWGNGRSEVHVGSSATNTWATAGTYNITLTVKDGSGLTGSLTKIVVVP